ncbi:MAG TPA: hypothetical protein VF169_12375 [Albitalea sp.]
MSAIELPAPKPPRSRLGKPRAALIAAAREGADAGEAAGGDAGGLAGGVAGDDAGELAGGDAGGVALPGAGADVAPVAGDGDPLPPQEATPVINIAMASRRTVDAPLNASDISLPFLSLIRHAETCCAALTLFVRPDRRFDTRRNAPAKERQVGTQFARFTRPAQCAALHAS